MFTKKWTDGMFLGLYFNEVFSKTGIMCFLISIGVYFLIYGRSASWTDLMLGVGVSSIIWVVGGYPLWRMWNRSAGS